MADIEQDSDLFVRIKNGVIIENYVLRRHIRNRKHPIGWYTRVIDTPQPEVNDFQYVLCTPTITLGGTVVMQKTVKDKSIDQILSGLVPENTSSTTELTPPDIADVDPKVVQRVFVLVGDYLASELDKFAATRQYSSFGSLVSYKDSSIVKMREEALRGISLRDSAWTALLTYFESVTTGQAPVPLSFAEIKAIIPSLTWD